MYISAGRLHFDTSDTAQPQPVNNIFPEMLYDNYIKVHNIIYVCESSVYLNNPSNKKNEIFISCYS